MIPSWQGVLLKVEVMCMSLAAERLTGKVDWATLSRVQLAPSLVYSLTPLIAFTTSGHVDLRYAQCRRWRKVMTNTGHSKSTKIRGLGRNPHWWFETRLPTPGDYVCCWVVVQLLSQQCHTVESCYFGGCVTSNQQSVSQWRIYSYSLTCCHTLHTKLAYSHSMSTPDQPVLALTLHQESNRLGTRAASFNS